MYSIISSNELAIITVNSLSSSSQPTYLNIKTIEIKPTLQGVE